MLTAPAYKARNMHMTLRMVSALTVLSPSAFAAPFVHPGILNNLTQLNYIRAQINAGTQPWKNAYNAANSSSYGSSSYTPNPRADVDCGAYSNPDNGCSDEKDDAVAAYTNALLWVFTGQTAHAQAAIRILDAWSSTVKTHTNANAPLQSAWAASVFPRAAEIIRYTNAGWTATEIAQFTNMLDSAYLPYIKNGSNSNGNWELAMIEGILNIGIFNDDSTLFQQAISMWRKRVPAYFYLTSDGPLPVQPPGEDLSQSQLISFWYNQSTFVDGLSQETCRDFGHMSYGLASTLNVAETALIQGVNLYAEQKDRLTAAMEFHAGYLDGEAVPSWLCGGSLSLAKDATWEIGYNEYHNRLGVALPNTLSLINTIRPTDADHMMVWETLTHAELDTTGITAVRAGTLSESKPPASILFFNGENFRVIWTNAHGSHETRGLNGAVLPASEANQLGP